MTSMRGSNVIWAVNMTYRLIFKSALVRVHCLIEIMRASKRTGHPRLGGFCARLLQRHGVYISRKSIIGEGLKLPHPVAIVIGEGVRIGNDVTIFQSVTLGGRVIGDGANGNYPMVSDGCVLFAGAVIVGKVHIGKNSVIGANSVVTSDIPDNSIAVGAPARVVKTRNFSYGQNLDDR